MPWPFDRLQPGALDRARLATMIFAVLNMLLPPLTQPALTPLQRLVSVGAVALMVANVVTMHVRQRFFRGEPLAAGLLTLSSGLYINSGSGVIGFVIGATIAQTLYGSLRSVMIRNAGAAIATVATAMLSRRPRTVRPRSPTTPRWPSWSSFRLCSPDSCG